MARYKYRPELLKILGLKVITIRGTYFGKHDSKTSIKPEYILFDDKKTVLHLEEQDYYSFHDCSSCAREISVLKNPELWQNIYSNTKNFPEPTID